MAVVILRRDGALFGPFEDRSAALTWAQVDYVPNRRWYSTYDLRAPDEGPSAGITRTLPPQVPSNAPIGAKPMK